MRTITVFSCFCVVCFGQSPTSQRERILQAVIAQAHESEPAESEKRLAEYRESEFRNLANHVADLWTDVMRQHQRHVVNVKKVRELVKAFHELEKSFPDAQ